MSLDVSTTIETIVFGALLCYGLMGSRLERVIGNIVKDLFLSPSEKELRQSKLAAFWVLHPELECVTVVNVDFYQIHRDVVDNMLSDRKHVLLLLKDLNFSKVKYRANLCSEHQGDVGLAYKILARHGVQWLYREDICRHSDEMVLRAVHYAIFPMLARVPHLRAGTYWRPSHPEKRLKVSHYV